MKKLFDVSDRLEVCMLVHALRERGIQVEMRGEFDPIEKPSVWVTEDETYDRATAIIAEIEKPPASPEQQAAAAFRKTFKPGFGLGLFLGILLGAGIFFGLDRAGFFPGKTSPTEWDTNKDGKIDCWRENKPDGSYVDIYDLNFDGQADSWQYYDREMKMQKSLSDVNYDGKVDNWTFLDDRGILEHLEYDFDFNGKVDSWSYYRNGLVVEEKFDNDEDGRVDEWAFLKDAKHIERRWSFLNDSTIDKRVYYKNNRKFKEEYDRNRDGTFEETILLDEFERVINRKRKQ